MNLYKVISVDNKSCNGGNFDWTEYLPQNNEPGRWTPVIEDINLCSRGYHVTPYPCMWVCDKTDRIFLVECQDVQEGQKTGTVDKVVAKSIRLVKEIFFNYDDKLNSGNRNSGNYNSGHHNSGSYNSGNRNSGDYNSGYNNSGNYNSGHHNSGNYNSGNRNSGNRNSGDYNSGDYNSGYNNSGNRNSGNYNSGHHNSGNRNSGDYNSGNRNSGSYNSGNYHTGFFNIDPNPPILVFGKQCDRKVWEDSKKPQFFFYLNESKESWAEAWEKASEEDKKLVKQLPNFDADIFFQITGIKVD